MSKTINSWSRESGETGPLLRIRNLQELQFKIDGIVSSAESADLYLGDIRKRLKQKAYVKTVENEHWLGGVALGIKRTRSFHYFQKHARELLKLELDVLSDNLDRLCQFADAAQRNLVLVDRHEHIRKLITKTKAMTVRFKVYAPDNENLGQCLADMESMLATLERGRLRQPILLNIDAAISLCFNIG